MFRGFCSVCQLGLRRAVKTVRVPWYLHKGLKKQIEQWLAKAAGADYCWP